MSRNQASVMRKILHGIMLFGLFFSTFGRGNMLSVQAQGEFNANSIVTRSYLKNGKLALKPKLGASQWILQTNNGQLLNPYYRSL
jgi:hypothetical protein